MATAICTITFDAVDTDDATATVEGWTLPGTEGGTITLVVEGTVPVDTPTLVGVPGSPATLGADGVVAFVPVTPPTPGESPNE